jgi:ketosteroid isomerase-like protein
MRILGIAIALCVAANADAKDATKTEIAKLVDQQIDAASDRADAGDADAIYASGVKIAFSDAAHEPLIEPKDIQLMRLQNHDDKHLEIQLTRDGQAAWVSLETEVKMASYGRDPCSAAAVDMYFTQKLRISDVVVKTPAGWRVVASAWSEPIGNVEANKAAKAGTAKLPALKAEGGDATLRAAFTKLGTDGFSAPATARKDLIVFGSAPGERTTSGPAFAKAWNATWAKHVAIDGPIVAGLAPSGTTGWVIANLTLSKTSGKSTYGVPFRVFFVFDQDAAGAWQLVHAQFATTKG